MIKIERSPNGYVSITGCLECDDAHYLWHDEGEWIIDIHGGLKGYHANYCPSCGAKLEEPKVLVQPPRSE